MVYADIGLVRFASEKYNLNEKDLTQKYIHLTNYAINKYNSKYVENDDDLEPNIDDNMITKWDFVHYCKYLSDAGIKYNDIFESIKDIIIKTLITIQPHVTHAMQRYSKAQDNCYDLYGFDILLDSSLRAHLLEVNICPSLSSSSRLDKRIKTILLSDLFHLIGIRMVEKPITKIQKKELGMLDVILTYEEQRSRKGNFTLIYPTKETVPKYSKYFDSVTQSDHGLWDYLSNDSKGIESYYKKV